MKISTLLILLLVTLSAHALLSAKSDFLLIAGIIVVGIACVLSVSHYPHAFSVMRVQSHYQVVNCHFKRRDNDEINSLGKTYLELRRGNHTFKCKLNMRRAPDGMVQMIAVGDTIYLENVGTDYGVFVLKKTYESDDLKPLVSIIPVAAY